MYVIHKRRVIIILCCLFIGISICFYQVKKVDKGKIEDAKVTTTIPVSGKVVVVDAGHGKPDERCTKRRWNNRGKY